MNTGYREETADSITLNFMNAGYYTFEEISVVCQPTAKLAEYTAARKENVLENIVLDANEISGTIHADRAEALLIAIPYSQGWTAWVDGAETELKKANTMYVALELEEGDHEIVLRYPAVNTPLVAPPSSISPCFFIVITIFPMEKLP